MKLIVGLGNPDQKYQNTRHNTGFMILDNFANLFQVIWKKKFNSLYAETKIKNEKVIFLKPQTYMNNSGESVRSFIDFFKIDIDDILIISDDLDLPIGQYRLRSHGSCGGHNGLRNIENHLHTDVYKRLRIGIASSMKNEDTIDYVLGKFSKQELLQLESIMETTNQILYDFLFTTFEELMSKYNHRK